MRFRKWSRVTTLLGIDPKPYLRTHIHTCVRTSLNGALLYTLISHKIEFVFNKFEAPCFCLHIYIDSKNQNRAMLCKTMKPSSFPSLTHLLLLLLLLLCLLLNEGQGRDSSLHNETNEADLSEPHEDDEAAIWITLSQSGLDWLKDVIVEQILTKITPVTFPDITSDSTVPFVGRFMSYFSNFTLLRAAVGSSIVLVNEEGILLMASDVATNLSLDWQYTYDNMWLPSPISDSGGAFIQVSSILFPFKLFSFLFLNIFYSWFV